MTYTVFGGRIRPEISLTIEGAPPVPAEDISRNIDHASKLNLGLESHSWRRIPLAIVGGGPSIGKHVDKLREWPGEIWAINGAWKWCQEHGIDATFFAIDPHPIVLQWAQGVTKAILATTCDPQVFDLLKDANVHTFALGEKSIKGGSSTATVAPHLAAKLGYISVTFFGCESSYQPNATHAYMNEDRTEELIIECNGGAFLTAADFYLQAQELATLIREFPDYLREESGGLLRSLIADPEFHVRWISDEMVKNVAMLHVDEPKRKAAE